MFVKDLRRSFSLRITVSGFLMSRYLELAAEWREIIVQKSKFLSELEMEDWRAAVLNWKFGVGLGAAWFLFRRVRNRQHYHHLCEYEYGQYKNVPDWLPSINGRTLDFLAWICNTQVFFITDKNYSDKLEGWRSVDQQNNHDSCWRS